MFSLVMVLLLISGCRNPDLREMDRYVDYACSNSKTFITFFAGVSIAMIFYIRMRRRSEN